MGFPKSFLCIISPSNVFEFFLFFFRFLGFGVLRTPVGNVNIVKIYSPFPVLLSSSFACLTLGIGEMKGFRNRRSKLSHKKVGSVKAPETQGKLVWMVDFVKNSVSCIRASPIGGSSGIATTQTSVFRGFQAQIWFFQLLAFFLCGFCSLSRMLVF